MQPDAHVGKCNGERGWVRALAVSIPDRSIWNEPGVPAASQIALCDSPSSDIALVLVGNPYRQSVQRHHAGLGEVEDVLVAIMQEARTRDWLVVPRGFFANRNRLHPLDGVLEHERSAQL